MLNMKGRRNMEGRKMKTLIRGVVAFFILAVVFTMIVEAVPPTAQSETTPLQPKPPAQVPPPPVPPAPAPPPQAPQAQNPASARAPSAQTEIKGTSAESETERGGDSAATNAIITIIVLGLLLALALGTVESAFH
jgi:uncharacterized membrane protein